MATMGRLSEQQLQLFFLLESIILAYRPEGFARVLDIDVAHATGALANSLETASHGLIFEEAASALVSEGLRKELRQVVDEISKSGGSRADREIAHVLRGIERGAQHQGGLEVEGPTAYLDLVGRVLQQGLPAKNPRQIVVP